MNAIFIFLLGLLLGILISHIFELSLKKITFLNKRYYRRHEIIFGYHIHHSLYGLAGICIGIVLYLKEIFALSLFFTAIGLGIIIMHTIFDGRLIFIEKEK